MRIFQIASQGSHVRLMSSKGCTGGFYFSVKGKAVLHWVLLKDKLSELHYLTWA